ncbi:hypothetical protein HY640_04610 [Candidatus Woesearchaeota archaeon]|nr:hypothetical protein [Candidatus Woesearchaeota archaeon]
MTTMVTFIGIAALIYILWSESAQHQEISKGKNIGERQLELMSAYTRSEKALHYADQATNTALEDAREELAKNGGYTKNADAKTSSPCGTYEGFALWQNKNHECYPDTGTTKKNYIATAEKLIRSHYSSYKDATIPPEYTYKIEEHLITGTAQGTITIKNAEPDKEIGQDYYTYTATHNFRHKINSDLEIYRELAEKAKEIIKACKGEPILESCSAKFNGKTETLTINTACEKAADKNTIKICAEKNGITYRFALKAETPNLGACEATSYIGEFKTTSYYTPRQDEFPECTETEPGKIWTEPSCQDFVKETTIQGSSMLTDGRILRNTGKLIEDPEGKYTRGITATGTNPTAKKTAAADPARIKPGSTIYLTFEENNQNNGIYTAEDTRATNENRIEIYRGEGKQSLTPALPETAKAYLLKC